MNLTLFLFLGIAQATTGEAIKFQLYGDLHVGTQRIAGSVTAAEAQAIAKSKACRPSSHSGADKLQQVDENLRMGDCWALKQIAGARLATTPVTKADIVGFTGLDLLSDSLLPPQGKDDAITFKTHGTELTIQTGPREHDFMPGHQVSYQPICHGDFSHHGVEELLVRKSFSAVGANFQDCEMLIVGKKKGQKIEIISRKPLGRCG